MARVLLGKEVAQVVKDRSRKIVVELQEKNITPCLGIVRVGERPDDLYYQSSLIKVCREVGLDFRIISLDQETSQVQLENAITSFCDNKSVHGVLLFSPLPPNLDEVAARQKIIQQKDVDCLTLAAAADVFTDAPDSFAPCTAAAVMEMLHYYDIPIQGKRAVIIGRSLVVGKPLAMLLLQKNATVTICHSKTVDLPKVCREADILVAAIGQAMMINEDYVKAGQIVIDVGINPHPQKKGRICGDLDYDAIEPIVEAITPVPGGVGSITSAILIWQTVLACQRMNKKNEYRKY
ncbi:MAG: bifunctional 5,10-methylenetetrahydrofolate dehydrogenase/5,10-methenyltetrahydrofolate cyclohydrolase [Bacillota bacterium]|jgi:methylenetetrahydrofolate dehydrogenase (NADP+)/methenyltetrahydrofolate cyclohydrolase